MNEPIVITPPKKIDFPDLGAIWNYRDLLYFLAISKLKTRFQQTFIGVFWIILQPLIQMSIFFVILGILVRVPTGNVPYPVFYLSGFVVWQVFNQIVNSSANSLIGNIGIITKTYFPRLILPLSTAVGTLIDFILNFLVLFVFLQFNNFAITPRYLFLPLLFIITLIFSLGVGLLFGALMVVFRDIQNLLGFLLQIWMFATPIMYPISIVPDQYKFIFYINPLAGLVDGYRWIVLGTDTLPSLVNIIISSGAALILLLVGLVAFHSMETKVVDVL